MFILMHIVYQIDISDISGVWHCQGIAPNAGGDTKKFKTQSLFSESINSGTGMSLNHGKVK